MLDLVNKNVIILTLVFIVGCTEKEQIDRNFTSKYWNLKVNKNDSNLIEYKDQALYFKNGAAYFFDKKIANYSISNDTHISYAQPSVWYEAHIEIPGLSLYGNFLAGVPFPLTGYNKFSA